MAHSFLTHLYTDTDERARYTVPARASLEGFVPSQTIVRGRITFGTNEATKLIAMFQI